MKTARSSRETESAELYEYGVGECDVTLQISTSSHYSDQCTAPLVVLHHTVAPRMLVFALRPAGGGGGNIP